MLYAFVDSGTVVSVGRLPNSARRLDNGSWVMGLSTAPAEMVEACGWFPVVDNPPAFDPVTEVRERSDVTLESGVPVMQYVVRDKTPAEVAEEADAADREAKRTSVAGAVSVLRGWADDAQSTTVTSGNAVQVLNLVVDRLGVFFDRFADLVEAQRLDVGNDGP